MVTGDRAWALGTADGYYPAAGFHTRGEMGGFWLPNLKLLDGMWFGINGDWIGPATRTTSGWGYVRADLPDHQRRPGQPHGLHPERGVRRAGRAEPAGQPDPDRSRLRADAHSELLGLLPLGRDHPEPDHREPAGHGRHRRPAHPVPRPRQAAAPEQSAPRLVGRLRLHAEADRRPDRRGLPRPAGPGGDLPGVRSERPDPAATAATTPTYGKGAGGRLDLRGPAAGRRGAHRLVRRRRLGVQPGRCPGPAAQGARRPGEGARRQGRAAEPDRPAHRGRPARQPAGRGQRALVQADAGRLRAAGERPRPAVGRRRQAVPAAGGHAGLDALVRRRLAGLHLAVRHRRRVHRLRRGRGRAVRRDQGPPAGAARRLGGDQPRPAARSCTRSPRTARSTSAPTRTRATPTSPRSTRPRWPWSGAGPATGASCATCTRPASGRWSSSPAWTRTATAGPAVSATSSGPGMGEEKLDNAVYTIRGYADLADMAAAVGDDRDPPLGRGQGPGPAAEVRAGLVVRRHHPLLRRLPRRRQREDLPAALDHADPDRRGAAADPRSGRRARWPPGRTRTPR